MAMVCGDGHYLGGKSTCPKCGWSEGGNTAPTMPNPPRMSWGEPLPSLDDPAFANAPAGNQVDAPAVPARWGELRGTVTVGEPVHVRSAGGIAVGQVLVLMLLLVGVIWKSDAIVLAITNGLLSLLLTYLVPIIVLIVVLSFVSKVIPIGGCLGQLFHVFTFFSPLTRRAGSSRDLNGWRVTVENANGATTAELAAPLHLDGGEEVSLHGPVISGVKHAWLIQVLSPRPTTRLARGVLPTLLVGLPLLTLLFVYLP